MTARDNPTPEAPAEDEPSLARIGTALFLAGFSTFSIIYSTQPLLPVFSAEFGVDAAESSLALSLTTGFLAISVFAAGALSETLGRRGLMFWSMLAAAVLNLLAALAPGWTSFLIARALVGVVLGGVPAVAMAYLSEEIPRRRLGFAMGLYVGGTALGSTIGRVSVGAMTEMVSWRFALEALAVADLIAAIAFIILLPRSRNFVRRPGLNPGLHMRAWAQHLRRSQLRALFLTGFLGLGAFVTLFNYVGYRLELPPYSLNQTQIGLIFLTYILGILASFGAGALADRLGRAPVAIAGCLLMILGLLITLVEPLAAIIAGIGIVTIGFFVVHSVASGWVGRLASQDKSHAASLYLLAYYTGSSVLGSAGGWFWHEGGWGLVIAYVGVMVLGLLGICTWLAAHDRAERERRYRELN